VDRQEVQLKIVGVGKKTGSTEARCEVLRKWVAAGGAEEMVGRAVDFEARSDWKGSFLSATNLSHAKGEQVQAKFS
jgi:hypothetical protein